MKQLEIEVNGARYLLVEVPSGIEIRIVKYPRSGSYLKQTNSKDLNGWDCKLPKGSYTLLGYTEDEDVCRGVLPEYENGWFRDYTTDRPDIMFKSPTESMSSLLRSKGVHRVNPFRKPDRDEIDKRISEGAKDHIWDLILQQWQKAQDNLWTGKILILKID